MSEYYINEKSLTHSYTYSQVVSANSCNNIEHRECVDDKPQFLHSSDQAHNVQIHTLCGRNEYTVMKNSSGTSIMLWVYNVIVMHHNTTHSALREWAEK